MPKKLSKKRRTSKSKSSILDIFSSLIPKSKKKNCYRLKNPSNDVLAEQVIRGEKVSGRQKKTMRKIVNEQKKKGKHCLKAANSADVFDISRIEKNL
jgi:hypothetical protein